MPYVFVSPSPFFVENNIGTLVVLFVGKQIEFMDLKCEQVESWGEKNKPAQPVLFHSSPQQSVCVCVCVCVRVRVRVCLHMYVTCAY